jgi:hypothetical protein
MSNGERTEQRPATPARIYDYLLGGTYNFPADREVAKKFLERYPDAHAIAQANRAFLRRAVRELVDAGVRQFLDIGSGIPTEGNVHEIAQAVAPDTRVVYVDIDPVAVAESMEMLEGNDSATAIRGDLRSPDAILAHPRLRNLLDFDQPIALLLVAVLHFVSDDADAYGSIEKLTAALASGSYLVISHAAAEAFQVSDETAKAVEEAYNRRTATATATRSRPEVARFFSGRIELVDPGVVYLVEWRPSPDDPKDFIDEPHRSGVWAAVGKIR